MKLERETVVRHGGWLTRTWDAVVNLVRGRRIVECGRCFGSGVQKVERYVIRTASGAAWSTPLLPPSVDPSDFTCVITTCQRCHGVGAVWR